MCKNPIPNRFGIAASYIEHSPVRIDDLLFKNYGDPPFGFDNESIIPHGIVFFNIFPVLSLIFFLFF